MLTFTEDEMPPGIGINVIFEGETMSDVNSQDLSQEILASPAKASIFLTVTVRSGGESVVIDLLTAVSGLTRAVGFRYPETMLSCVVGIGAGMWDRLFDVPRPEYLHDFEALQGGKHSAPSTPGDLFFHLRASTLDMCFELARQIMRRLGSAVSTYDEVHAFRYLDNRDPLGLAAGDEGALPGGGPLLKINANQRYATDSVGAGVFAAACAKAGVPYQEFVSNNNMPCGSTIGPITATRLGMRTVDVGIGLLSMHSMREMCHVDDMAYMTRAVEGFFRL